MNKKASMIDLMMIVITLAVLTVTIVFGAFIWEKVNTGVAGSMDAQTNATVENMRMSVTSALDYLAPVVVIFTAIGLLVLAKFTNAHPIWYVFALILLIFGVFLAVVWQDLLVSMLQTNADIDATYSGFPITQWFVNNLHFIVFGVGIMVMIVMYVTRSGDYGI